jgi:amidase
VLKAQVERGKAVPATDYLAAKAVQEKWRMALPKEMSGFDALLTLPAFGEAPRGLDSTGDAEYCAPWTFIGAPAVNLPAGFGPNGLPLGIQIVGRYREDLRVLRIAKWMEVAIGFDPGIPKIMS